MGVFDEILYNRELYQTKDTPAQCLELYEIRGDELWYKEVEREYVKDEEHILGGYLTEVSHEWKFCKNFDGLIRFYREDKENGGYKEDKWIEYKALFMDGKILKLERIE